MLTITVKKRDGASSAKESRAGGFIPAVYYGPKTESTPIELSYNEFQKVLNEAGETAVVTLQTSPTESFDALIHELSVDPVTEKITHVDFYIFDKTRAVEVTVPLVFEGVSVVVKELGGTLVKVLHEVDVKALPGSIPHELMVDISPLNTFNDQIHVRDVVIPAGVTILNDAEEVIALVAEAVEEEEEVAAPADLSSIEVEKKGKKEEEATEGGSSTEATT